MKTLKFERRLVDLVLSGKKNTTWRVFDDKNLTKGDAVVFINAQTGKQFAKAKLTNVKETTFGKLTKNNTKGHKKYSSLDAMLKTFSSYYSELITKETSLKVIKFKLV